jgi:hypothetical protein
VDGGRRQALSAAVLTVALGSGASCFAQAPPGSAPPAPAPAEVQDDQPVQGGKDRTFRAELKRDFTDRGTPDETTKTTIKLTAYFEGILSQLRLDLPFPDAETDFGGSITEPRLGDVKLRATFRDVRAGTLGLVSFLEMTFPTANPEDLGSGKYQLSAGVRTVVPFSLGEAAPVSHRLTFRPLVQQYVSVAGDPDYKDIDNTRLEIGLRDTWRKKAWLGAKVKTTVDWENGGATGAVGEIEVGGFLSRVLSAWITAGARLWGGPVPGTYDHRLSIALAGDF